ncbi:MAG: hypothetical protein ACLS90_01470 [Clostridia bacterium]|jgi:DNA-directed RNA polymerase specialized sigma24 family protein
MTEKESRRELYSYLHSKKLEERKINQIEEIKTKLTKTTTVLSDIPVGTPDNDKMAKNIARLLELISEHIEIMQKEEENLIRITNKIKMVEQPYKNILELRFVEGMKVEEVSVEIDKAYRYTKTLIKKAIKEYAKL